MSGSNAIVRREKLAGFIYTEDVVRQAQRIETWDRRLAKRERRSRNLWCAYGIFSTILLFMSIGSINYLIPLRQIIPVLFWQRADGATEWAITTDSMPQDMADANIQAWLWQYVSHRENYSWAEAQLNYHFTQAMSAPDVFEAYDKWANGKNKESYLSKYGRTAVIRTTLRQVYHFERATGGTRGSITFNYERGVQEGEQRPARPVLMTVTISFVQNYRKGIDLRDVYMSNPSRIVVTDYAAPYPVTPEQTP